MSMQLDPNRNTREEWTFAATQQGIPDDASPQWKALNQALKDLMHKLVYHESMRENRLQPFMTPAASKNRVYFMWDFVGRTLPNLYQVPPQLNDSPLWDEEMATLYAEDCVGRSAYAAKLILMEGDDEDPRVPLNVMVEELYRDQAGRHPDFGDEIKDLARNLIEVCMNQGN